MSRAWTCPFCNRDATITDSDVSGFSHTLFVENKIGKDKIIGEFVVCPNDKCKKYTLQLFLGETKVNQFNTREYGKTKKMWSLIPPSSAKPFPSYIPKPIIKDYEEACLILSDSPKASAALSRRCLQGMIRDFWKIKRPEDHKGPWRLVEEIEAIKEKMDPLTWRAIDGVRKIGNIGAHMETDINIIIEVEPEEASKLIELIELLIKDWYINKYERETRLAEITAIAEKKAEAKNSK